MVEKNITSYNNRNNSIDIFRLICSIMVVTIHTAPLNDINITAGYIITQVFPRIAVPFFFCIAGYFYIGGLLEDKKIFKKYIMNLFFVYSFWSLIYFSFSFFRAVMNGISLMIFVKDSVLNFFFIGSAYHLWFFPALFFSIIVITLIHKFNLIKIFSWITVGLYLIGCLGCSYYSIGNKIPFVSQLINHSQFNLIRRVILMGLPFFTLGYFINKIKQKHKSVSNKNLILLFIIFFILFIAEMFYVVFFKLQSSVVITVFLYPLLLVVMLFLINYPFPLLGKTAHASRILANFTYYAHPMIIIVINVFLSVVFDYQFTETPTFIATCIIALLGGVIILKLNNKWLNKIVV